MLGGWFIDDRHGIRGNARYLGPHLSYDLKCSPEVTRRIQVATYAYTCYCGLWRRRVDVSYKSLVFYAVVVSTLTSGMSCFDLSDYEVERLEKVQTKLARRCLAGIATEKSGQIEKNSVTIGYKKYRSMTNDHVLKFLKLPRIMDILRSSRLRFWQRVAAQPKNHKQLLAAVFWTDAYD